MCGSASAEVETSSPVNHSLKPIFICELSLILVHKNNLLAFNLSAVFKALCNSAVVLH